MDSKRGKGQSVAEKERQRRWERLNRVLGAVLWTMMMGFVWWFGWFGFSRPRHLWVWIIIMVMMGLLYFVGTSFVYARLTRRRRERGG